jgi:hypothetical protein
MAWPVLEGTPAMFARLLEAKSAADAALFAFSSLK